MAATIQLPEPLLRGLRDIAALSEDDFVVFLEALKSIPTEIRQHRVFPDVLIPGRADNGESMKGAAFALALGRAQRRASIAETAAGLKQTVTGLNPEQLGVLEQRATAILDIESLDLIARSHYVLLEHSRTYSSARIISDIRAVFGDEVNVQPDGAVIVHMLNVIYNSAGRRENISLALDEKDIDLLMAVLERAREKNKTLKQTIEKSGLKYVKVT